MYVGAPAYARHAAEETNWAQYMSDQRRYRWENTPKKGGRAAVSGGAHAWSPSGDYKAVSVTARAAAALLTRSSPSTKILRNASRQFARTLEELESRQPTYEELEHGVTVVPVFSDDVHAFADNPAALIQPADIREAVADAELTAEAMGFGAQSPLPPGDPELPAVKPAPAGDDARILRLEQKVAPFVDELGRLQTAAAHRIADVADRLARRKTAPAYGGASPAAGRATPSVSGHASPSASGHASPSASRRASGHASPSASRRASGHASPSASGRDFSTSSTDDREIAEENSGDMLDVPSVLAAKWRMPESDGAELSYGEGAYAGGVLSPVKGPESGRLLLLALRTDWRETALHPHTLFNAGIATASGKYDWTFIDSPEARYALRMPLGETPPPIDDIRADLLPRLEGAPPHKMPVGQYAQFMRDRGYEVQFAPKVKDAQARFTRTMLYKNADLFAEREGLMAMSQRDFDALDWREVDAQLRPLLQERWERSGDLFLRPAAGAATVLDVAKIRDGKIGVETILPRTSFSYTATHRRPGSAMLRLTLTHAVSFAVAWDVILTPQRYYILGVGAELLALLPVDWEAAMSRVRALGASWAESEPDEKAYCTALTKAGFLVRTHDSSSYASSADGRGAARAANRSTI
jgi:hypothetical protein